MLFTELAFNKVLQYSESIFTT